MTEHANPPAGSPRDLLAGYPVVIEQVVAWGEMDAFHHVNNVVYFRYFENVRIEYVRRVGWLDMTKETGIGLVVSAVQARFRRPVTWPDTLLVATRVRELGEDRLHMDHAIVSTKQGVLVTEGHGTVVCYDQHNHRKAPIPDELRRRIQELEATAPGPK